MFYVDKRWAPSSSWEKVLMFFLVFLFFPGFILLGPFYNFRPKLRSLS
jgi:NAD(P)H-quinone oxidoreductase subunit L